MSDVPTPEQLSNMPILLCTNGTKHHQWANVVGGRQCQRPGCGVAIRDGVAVGSDSGDGTVYEIEPEPPVEELDTSYATEDSTAKIDHEFDYHAPNDSRRRHHEAIRHECRSLAHFMDDHLPPGREKALARTHLETVMFWANAAIARDGES